MSAYNFDEDLIFLKYMEEGIIDSSIDKPVTMNRLYQRVRDELNAYDAVKWFRILKINISQDKQWMSFIHTQNVTYAFNIEGIDNNG